EAAVGGSDRRGVSGGFVSKVAESVSGDRNAERLWANGVFRRRDALRDGARVERSRAETVADRQAAVEHRGVRAGWRGRAGAGGSARRALHWRRRSGTWVLAATGADGREIRCGSFRQARGSTAVPDWRCRAVAGRGDDRVSGAAGPSGEDPWLPDRVGRD